MRLITTYQNRSVAVIPGTAAGTFRMEILNENLVRYYISHIPDSEFVRVALVETAERYRAGYEATGLPQSLGALYGHIGAGGVPQSAMERMSEKEMSVWRAWCLWRSCMNSEESSVVDDVVIYDHKTKKQGTLRSGLMALARSIGTLS